MCGLFSACGEQRLLSSCGAQASHCRGFSRCGAQARAVQASSVVTRGLSSSGTQAQLLHGMWGLSGPGIEPASPALAGGSFDTEPPRKPLFCRC